MHLIFLRRQWPRNTGLASYHGRGISACAHRTLQKSYGSPTCSSSSLPSEQARQRPLFPVLGHLGWTSIGRTLVLTEPLRLLTVWEPVNLIVCGSGENAGNWASHCQTNPFLERSLHIDSPWKPIQSLNPSWRMRGMGRSYFQMLSSNKWSLDRDCHQLLLSRACDLVGEGVRSGL
jgi:hypothetical protein